MSGQNSKDIFNSAFLLYSPIILLLIHQTTALPFSRRAVPWASPCTPGSYSTSMESGVDKNNIGYLIEKTQDSYFIAEYIEHMIKLQINDPQIIEYVRNKNLDGFPKPFALETTEKADSMQMLIENYGQLSKVAVFLDYIYRQDIDRDIKTEIKELQFSNLSQMCEIQMAFANKNHPQKFPVADSSIIPNTTHHSRSAFRLFENTLTVIVKYLELLDFHMYQYNTDRKF